MKVVRAVAACWSHSVPVDLPYVGWHWHDPPPLWSRVPLFPSQPQDKMLLLRMSSGGRGQHTGLSAVHHSVLGISPLSSRGARVECWPRVRSESPTSGMKTLAGSKLVLFCFVFSFVLYFFRQHRPWRDALTRSEEDLACGTARSRHARTSDRCYKRTQERCWESR